MIGNDVPGAVLYFFWDEDAFVVRALWLMNLCGMEMNIDRSTIVPMWVWVRLRKACYCKILQAWTIGIQLAWANHHWIVGKNMDIKPIWNRLTMSKAGIKSEAPEQVCPRCDLFLGLDIYRHPFISLPHWHCGRAAVVPSLGVGWPPAARQGWWRPVERWRWSHACGAPVGWTTSN